MSHPPDKKPAANVEDSDLDSDSDSDSDSGFHLPCHSCVDMTYGLEIKTNNISHFGYNLRAAITNCEIMIIDYNKRQRELSPVAGPSNAVVQVDANAPSCSGSSANAGADIGPDAGINAGAVAGAETGAETDAEAGAEAGAKAGGEASSEAGAKAGGEASSEASSDTDAAAGAVADDNASVDAGANASGSNEIDIFSEHKEELADYVRQMNYRRTRNSEKQTLGSWLFISYVNGGWDYDTVRNYLLEQINCQSTLQATCPIRIPMDLGLAF